jgi:hypothetical protein
MNRLSPRRLVTVLVTPVILAIPFVSAVLTAAPVCGGNCFPLFWWWLLP